MKKITQYPILILISLVLWKCQPILKAPAAAIMSTTLPTPEIDTTLKNLPNADYTLQVKDLDGKIVNMHNYRGKIIFLNFWATWCMPCVAELPSINKLYNRFKNNDNIAFLLISNESIEKVKSYHQKKGYKVPFYIIDQDGHVPNIYFSPSIPTTFIINKEGKIVKSTMGAEDWDDDDFIKTIEKLINN